MVELSNAEYTQPKGKSAGYSPAKPKPLMLQTAMKNCCFANNRLRDISSHLFLMIATQSYQISTSIQPTNGRFESAARVESEE